MRLIDAFFKVLYAVAQRVQYALELCLILLGELLTLVIKYPVSEVLKLLGELSLQVFELCFLLSEALYQVAVLILQGSQFDLQVFTLAALLCSLAFGGLYITAQAFDDCLSGTDLFVRDE